MRFEKWTASGNDYIIIGADDLPADWGEPKIRTLCRRHTGIGSDGALVVSPMRSGTGSRDGDEILMRVYNADGSEDDMSGNGAAQATCYGLRRGWTVGNLVTVVTHSSSVSVQVAGGRCDVNLGRARVAARSGPRADDDGMTKLSVIDCELWSRQIWVGNPQCAVEIDRDPSTFALHRYGPPLVDHPQFADRTNVSIWQRVCAHHIRARTFERGVGETLSSGTGAAGAAVASVLAGGASPVTVHLPGGTLEVSVDTELAVTVSVRPVPLFAGTTHSALPLCGGTADVRTAR